MREEETDNEYYLIWQKIILLAFSPSGSTDINAWFSCFSKSLQDFWELDNPTKQEGFKLEIYNNNIPLSFDFSYSNSNKFTVAIYYPNNNNNLLWEHDVDKKYYSPYNKQNTFKDVNINQISDSDIKEVLDGFLFHPAVHQHIKEPVSEHLIRIGGGINNPFQFLFHLRYQLCLIQEKRDEEERRLLNLFSNSLKRKKRIPPSELMGLHKRSKVKNI